MYSMPLDNSQSKQVDGFLFHWVTQCKDTPFLLFIHGSQHGAWCYENYYEYFYKLGYNIASVDFPGRGGVPQGDGFLDLSVEQVSKTLRKAMASIDDINSFVAIGHSLGSLSAGMVASEADNVCGLILLTPAPPAQVEGAQALPPVDTDTPKEVGDKDAVFARFWPHIEDQQLLDSLYAQLTPESPYLTNQRYNVSCHIPWTPSKCPALVIEASMDIPDTHPPMQDKKVADFYQADYIYMEDIGHCLMVGPNWEQSADYIRQWLHTHL